MNIKTGMISVIIPVYNREKYIEECLNSVFAQSYQNFEIVLVDDGSTDNTLSICKELAKKDSRIKIFEGEHKGVSAARNVALDNAEGEYVFFLDSDDTIHPLLFEALVESMQNDGVYIAATACFAIRQQNWYKLEVAKEKYPAPAEFDFLDNNKAVESMLITGGTPINLIGGCMMNRDYVADTRFNIDIHIGEDFLFIYENLIKGTRTAFLKQKWYYERLHKSNTSFDYSFNGFLTRFNRRLLVAQSEENLGRMAFANNERRKAFFIFSYVQKRNNLKSQDAKKMRKHVKKHKKILFSAFGVKEKIQYYFAVYCPALYYKILKYRSKVKKS